MRRAALSSFSSLDAAFLAHRQRHRLYFWDMGQGMGLALFWARHNVLVEVHVS
jgi:hypothetical protein